MRREIVLLVLLVCVLGALLYFSKSLHPVSTSDAKKFFLENLAQNYPSADAREIMDVVPIGSDGTLRLKARVSSNMQTPCPERLHIYYNYPSKNFIYEYENITGGCTLCRDTPTCIIAWPEEAIIASHKYPGAEKVSSYIRQYPDSVPLAAFLQDFEGMQNVWEVQWDSPAAGNSLTVYLSKTENRIISVRENAKSS